MSDLKWTGEYGRGWDGVRRERRGGVYETRAKDKVRRREWDQNPMLDMARRRRKEMIQGS